MFCFVFLCHFQIHTNQYIYSAIFCLIFVFHVCIKYWHWLKIFTFFPLFPPLTGSHKRMKKCYSHFKHLFLYVPMPVPIWVHHEPIDSCGGLRASDAALELELLVDMSHLMCVLGTWIHATPVPKKCFSDFSPPLKTCWSCCRDRFPQLKDSMKDHGSN